MKVLITSLIFLLTSLSLLAQNNLQLFEGSFDSALIQASIQNKNIFFITRSESCPVFREFRTTIENDKNTYDFLNREFIIFEYDMDHTNKTDYRKLKKYYHSWRGFPQIYFLTENEDVIAEFGYSIIIKHEDQLELWKDYKNTEKEWGELNKLSKKDSISYENLWKYMAYRDMIYSPFGDMQINKRVSWYFNGLDTIDYSLKKHWILFKRHVNLNDLGTNPELFDFVARNKSAFQEENGDKEVVDYLFDIYYSNLPGRKEKKIDKMANKYPYNTIVEAQDAIQIFRRNKIIQNLFN